MQAEKGMGMSTLDKARRQLDAMIEQLKEASYLRRWHVWHGPAGGLSEANALKGAGSGWTEVNMPHGWSTASVDTWLRCKVTYPESIGDIPTEGALAELAIAMPVKSRVYIDSRVAAGADWWLDARVAPIPLAEALEPGRSIEIACHIPQGDGLGGFGGAEIRYQQVEKAIFDLELLRAQLTFSRLLVTKSREPARLREWRQAVEALPWDDLEARRWEAWRSKAAAVVEKLAKLTPEAKEYRVYAAAHAHIDMNWLWPWEDTVNVIRRDFQAMDHLMERFPQFHFSQSQASTYWAMEKHNPEILARVAERVREGRWEVTANTWVENDLNMSAGEATAHHFLHTRRYMRRLFGLAPRLVWEPDTFGHPATMPQIAHKGGAEYYYFCRGGRGYPLFWWESPDGSRILGFQDLHWYLGDLMPRVVADSAVELAELYGLKSSLVVYGAGDHGGGATARDLEAALAINAAPCLPTVQPSSVSEFFDAVKKAAPELPVVRGELNPVFAGCYTSHADVKRLNRSGEAALLDAESLATVAALNAGFKYPQAELEQNWRDILFQQFHDILCGCGIGLTSKTAHEWAGPAIARTRQITRNALETLCAQLRLGRDKRPALVVYNTLPWRRDDVVKAPPDWACAWVEDNSGYILPTQRSGSELIFVAQDIPALGCRVYRPGDATSVLSEWDYAIVRSPADLTLENEYFCFTVDAHSGAISYFYDKEAERDLTFHARGDKNAELDTRGALNRMQIWREQPHGMSAWKLGDISRVEHLVKDAEVRLVESGPLRGMIEVQRRFLHSSLVQRIILYQGLCRIDFETEVEWHEKGSDRADAPMLRVRFEPSLGETRATFQIPFGVIERPADGQEVVAQMWADLSEVDGQYGVALLNNCKYGYQAHGNTLGLTLIRASYEPDQNPDEGHHAFTYALYPHLGSWREAEVERHAQELNRPLLTHIAAPGRQAGGASSLKIGLSALSCTPKNVQVTALKFAEDGDGVIVRLVEMHGRKCTARLRLIQPILAAEEVSLAEEPLAENTKGIAVVEGKLRVALSPYEIRTIRLQVGK